MHHGVEVGAVSHVECNCQGIRVASSGSNDAPILVIGMAPGTEELERGTPFVGRSGSLLWKTLAKFGIDRADCRVVNTICGWPEGKDGNPTPAQLAACSSRFDREMKQSRARVVMVLGGAAIKRTLGINRQVQKIACYLVKPEEAQPRKVKERQIIGVYKSNGKYGKKGDPKYGPVELLIQPTLPPQAEWFVMNYHPAGVQRAGWKPLDAFVRGCDKLARAWKGELKLVTIESVSETPTVFDLMPGERLAFDIETPMDSDMIERIGFASPAGVWSAPWNAETKEAAKRLLGNPQTVKVAHNISFDISRLEKWGVKVAGPLHCTMQGTNILHPDLPYGLEPTAPLNIDCRMWKHTSGTDPAFYNATDALNDLHVAEVQDNELVELGMSRLFHKVVMPGYRPLMDMTRIGFRLDPQRLSRWLVNLEAEQGDARQEWSRIAGPVNHNSPHQLKRLFYGQLRLPAKYNKYGNSTLDEEALNELRDEHPQSAPVIDALLRLRKVSKLVSTYAHAAQSEDGCVHPSYLPKGRFDEMDDFEETGARKGMTPTLRLTSSGPNLQNQPPIARKLYIPHDPRLSIVELDFNQIELRIQAGASGDHKMMAAIAGDMHAATRQIMAGIGLDVTRDVAKIINYAISYFASTQKIAKTLRREGIPCTLEQAQRVIDAVGREYVAWHNWRMKIVDFCAAHHYVVNPFGFRRSLYGGRKDQTKAVNTIPQSTAGYILWDRLVPMHSLFREFGGELLVTVHDSFVGEVPTSAVGGFVATARECMMVEYPQIATGFRVPVKAKFGPSWGELVEVK